MLSNITAKTPQRPAPIRLKPVVFDMLVGIVTSTPLNDNDYQSYLVSSKFQCFFISQRYKLTLILQNTNLRK